MSLSITAGFQITPRLSKTAALIASGLVATPNIRPPDLSWLDGSGSGQVSRIVLLQGVLGASATVDHILSNGSLSDPFGDPVEFTNIRAMYFRPTLGTDGLTVGGAGAGTAFVGPFGSGTHKLTIPLGSWLPLLHPTTGWVVTPSTGDALRIAAGASGASYDMLLAGIDV